jgi:hypothetical protein
LIEAAAGLTYKHGAIDFLCAGERSKSVIEFVTITFMLELFMLLVFLCMTVYVFWKKGMRAGVLLGVATVLYAAAVFLTTVLPALVIILVRTGGILLFFFALYKYDYAQRNN